VKMIMLRREGLTYDEIAAHIGVNEKTVRRIIDSARSRMEAR
jgi:DNA-directed RNA polymerase specialized sigma24 family protein